MTDPTLPLQILTELEYTDLSTRELSKLLKMPIRDIERALHGLQKANQTKTKPRADGSGVWTLT